MIKIDRIETRILDIPTIREHVLSMTTMTMQSVVLVRMFLGRFGRPGRGHLDRRHELWPGKHQDRHRYL